MYLQSIEKLIDWLIGKKVERTTIPFWNWLWRIPFEFGDKVTMIVTEPSIQSIPEKASVINIDCIEKIAQVDWQRDKVAIEIGSTNQGVRSFGLEMKLSLKLLLDAKDESEEISRNVYESFQQLKYQLNKTKNTVDWIEREFPNYFSIEEYERLEVINRFKDDFNNFAHGIVKQYVAGEFFAVREALKAKEEQCNNYLNTLKVISQLPDQLYQKLGVEGKNLKLIFKDDP